MRLSSGSTGQLSHERLKATECNCVILCCLKQISTWFGALRDKKARSCIISAINIFFRKNFKITALNDTHG